MDIFGPSELGRQPHMNRHRRLTGPSASTLVKLLEQILPKTKILYKGSVSRATVPELSTKPDIDEFIIGGSSLKPEVSDVVDCSSSEKSLKSVNIGINGCGRIGRLGIHCLE